MAGVPVRSGAGSVAKGRLVIALTRAMGGNKPDLRDFLYNFRAWLCLIETSAKFDLALGIVCAIARTRTPPTGGRTLKFSGHALLLLVKQ